MSISRYFVKFSYNGKPYKGWQRQPNAISVQAVLEEAMSTVLRTPIVLTAAGRTDTGVHAREMYAHFDTGIEIADKAAYKINAYLSKEVAVKTIFPVSENAHARFDALSRTYQYIITPCKEVFLFDYAYYYNYGLDLDKMNQATSILLEETHFKCFSKSNTDVKTDICHISQAHWQQKDEKIYFTITANRFLRNMVRAIVGTFLDIGTGKINSEELKSIIKSQNRSQSGVSVPPHGLYLTKIQYPLTIYEQKRS